MTGEDTKIIISYGDKHYEVKLFGIPPEFKQQIEAGVYTALCRFHGDYTSVNKRIWRIKALINDYLSGVDYFPDELIEALKK